MLGTPLGTAFWFRHSRAGRRSIPGRYVEAHGYGFRAAAHL